MSEKTVYPRISGLSSVIAAAVILLNEYIADQDNMTEYGRYIGDEDEQDEYERLLYYETAPYQSALYVLRKIVDEDEVQRILEQIAEHRHIDIRI